MIISTVSTRFSDLNTCKSVGSHSHLHVSNYAITMEGRRESSTRTEAGRDEKRKRIPKTVKAPLPLFIQPQRKESMGISICPLQFKYWRGYVKYIHFPNNITSLQLIHFSFDPYSSSLIQQETLPLNKQSSAMIREEVHHHHLATSLFTIHHLCPSRFYISPLFHSVVLRKIGIEKRNRTIAMSCMCFRYFRLGKSLTRKCTTKIWDTFQQRRWQP